MNVDKDTLKEFVTINPAGKVRDMAMTMIDLLTPNQINAIGQHFTLSLQWQGITSADLRNPVVEAPTAVIRKPNRTKEIFQEIEDDEDGEPEEDAEEENSEAEEEGEMMPPPQRPQPQPRRMPQPPRNPEEEFNRIIGKR